MKLSDNEKQLINDQIICSSLHVISEIKPELKFYEDLNINWLDRLDIIVHVEESFNIYITDEEDESIITVQDLYNMIELKRNITN